VIEEGTRQRVFRASRYRDPTRMIVAIMEAMVPYTDVEGGEILLDNVLTLLERGVKRTLRLRSWENRKDRVGRRRGQTLEPDAETDLP